MVRAGYGLIWKAVVTPEIVLSADIPSKRTLGAAFFNGNKICCTLD